MGLVVLPMRGRRMTRGVIGGRVGVAETDSGVDPVKEVEAVDLEGVAVTFFLFVPP